MRKKSIDPAQEKLREMKDLWNENTSAYISSIISLKRGLNGRGDPAAGLPSSKIQYPLPEEVAAALDKFNANSQAIYNQAKGIMEYQRSYSEKRRQPKTASIKNASWVGTRLFSTIVNYPFAWFTNDEVLKSKLRLLYIMKDLKDKTNLVEVKVQSSNEVFDAVIDFYKMIQSVHLSFSPILDQLIKEFTQQASTAVAVDPKLESKTTQEQTPGSPPLPADKTSKIPGLMPQREMTLAEHIESLLPSMNSEIKIIEHRIDILLRDEDLSSISQQQRIKYDQSLIEMQRVISNAAANKDEQSLYELKEAYDEFKGLIEDLLLTLLPVELNGARIKYDQFLEMQLDEDEDSKVDENDLKDLEKTAAYNLSRWLGRFKLMMSFNEMARTRLLLSKKLNNLSNQINEAMNLFEKKNSSMQDIIIKVYEIYKSIADISEFMAKLARSYNLSVAYAKKTDDTSFISFKDGDISRLEREGPKFMQMADDLYTILYPPVEERKK